MRFSYTSATIALAMAALAGPALAEGEGPGEPFAFSAPALRTAGGLPFVMDAGQEAYPQSTGNANQTSSLAQLEPGFARERLVQSTNSMPASGWPRTGDFPQTPNRQLASRAAPVR